jgi:hypothetical protein
MSELLEVAFDAVGAAFEKLWDTRSLALFLTGLSKIVWIIGLLITFTAAFGFTGYILFLYLISAICFVGCPCLGIMMGVGVTALWGTLAFYAIAALTITLAAASLIAILAIPAVFLNPLERKSVIFYAGFHILLIGILTYFGVTKYILESEILGRFLNIPKIEKNIDGDPNTKAPQAKSEVATKIDSNIKNENQAEVQSIEKLLDLADPEKTKQFRKFIKEKVNFIKSSKENSYFIQFGAFNSLRECFDYKNDFLRDLETLYVRSDSPKFVRVPILTKEKKPAVVILFGPFDSIEDAKGEISGDGPSPPKHWVRSTQSIKDVLIDLP